MIITVIITVIVTVIVTVIITDCLHYIRKNHLTLVENTFYRDQENALAEDPDLMLFVTREKSL